MKLVICVPTYNRSDIVGKMLETEMKMLKRKGVDMFIYDSSTDVLTKECVEKFIEKGYENLHYERVNSELPSSEKVLKIYQDFEQSEYDYVWMIHDHTVYTEKMIEKLLDALKANLDFYCMDILSTDYSLSRIDNKDDFLIQCAWILNRFGASIISVKSFLQGTNWNLIKDKYLDGKISNFSHEGFYFERSSEIKGARIGYIKMPREYFENLTLQDGVSWSDDSIRICTESWGGMVMSLPYSYETKKEALGGVEKGYVSCQQLLELKKKGKYTFTDFIRYHKWFKVMFPENLFKFFLIAVLSTGIASKLIDGKLITQIKKAKAKDKKVVIYGAGILASKCAKSIEMCDLDFDAFIVTKRDGNPDLLMGHKVYLANDYLNDNNAFVIIAVATRCISDVEKLLKENNSTNRLNYIIYK